MHVLLGAITGFLGFLPEFLSVRLSRRSAAQDAMTIGLYALSGVCVSLIILVIGLLVCAKVAREAIVPFAIAEVAVFLGATIAYVVYKNLLAKRKAPREQ